MRLDDVETARTCAIWPPPAAPRRIGSIDPHQILDPGLLRLMTALGHLPVLLLAHRAEGLARNALLRAVLGRGLEVGTSFLRYMFHDDLARERIANWAQFACAAVAAARHEVGRRPHDHQLVALIDELRADPLVDSWWTIMKCATRCPVAGRLRRSARRG
ncbi:MmyB family transcriptional regulator [Jatrophihabitans lederbergiae]|uniref:MmyB-like transcription regulator ligand binding domain-containing protein n=1 Tax=Jatrophihabitans lederbergiae TaxID=3075547 RepID=A0ABU2J5P8_9ACTN|nr:hypothetical protein [Jatrophihabitans sp. DSM 44399]MDT0260317.1 hypothetical protein [Jatrophihabitans sp. DSM 44399]